MIIYFATGNAGKVKSMTEHLHGANIEIHQITLDLIEPQANTVEEVASSKARQAFEQLGTAVVVEDSGFYIDELNGFPGPYIKYMLETIGIEKILQLTKNLSSRKCHFISALAYIDHDGESKVFVEKGPDGELATSIAPPDNQHAWSELWRIFIPNGAKNALSALTDDERQILRNARQKQSNLVAFSKWLNNSEL